MVADADKLFSLCYLNLSPDQSPITPLGTLMKPIQVSAINLHTGAFIAAFLLIAFILLRPWLPV